MKKKYLHEFFPEKSKILLTGGGKEFVERIGIETIKKVILSVMMGENIRTQTEPLSRRRIAQINGALIAMFLQGCLEIKNFTDSVPKLALEDIENNKGNAIIWPAQWMIGLTGKSIQNVLRSNKAAFIDYVRTFEEAVHESAGKCKKDLGDLVMTLGFMEDKEGKRVKLDWRDIILLTTAIGSQTLTIRGSDKSIYGKLFEKLILGSFLSIMGFERVFPEKNTKTNDVFWLSDSSDNRESDATLLFRPGSLARFDIGFIGIGNPEISKDKLSRFAREIESSKGEKSSSVTFIVVDRLPNTSKTEAAAKKIGAEIIQMSMQYWPRELAIKMGKRLGFKHELQKMPNNKIQEYLEKKLKDIPVQDFLNGLPIMDVDSVDIETI